MDDSKKRVALIFGGRSTEHEVSLSSALGILSNIDRSRYEVFLIKITAEGRWMHIDDPASVTSVNALKKAVGPLVFTGDPGLKGFWKLKKDGTGEYLSVDVVFPMLHGTFGEDGTVQGMIGLAELPCVGAGVLASALGMDKIFMKQLFFQNDIPSPDYLWFLRKNWKTSRDAIRSGVEREIGFPCFVKPANTGSSVGVYKIHNGSEFDSCVEEAARFDRKLLVEKAIDARELECAVLGNDNPEASPVGEIIPANEFYDYDAKYKNSRSKTLVPADIPEETALEIRRMAVKVFQALDCAGMGRVDFLLDRKTNKIYANEINTLPGFTPISMYPKLWEAAGIPYTELIDRLIRFALERHADLQDRQIMR